MPPRLPHIELVFGENGYLARLLEGFEFRPSQIQMARLITESLLKGVPAIVEAGTGTGKTLGYLVPVILSGKKCVISTGTRNLQEQIYFKDIPLISNAIGRRVSAMLMKGRKNYLCLQRYHQLFSTASLAEPSRGDTGQKIEKWLKETEFADRAELTWLMDDDPIWDKISASSDQCLGSDCSHMEDCYLNRLRRKAAQSDIIIVNHHLFFADLMVKKSGFGEIIPRFQVVIFDEAHKIEEIATTYFGVTASTGQLADLLSDMEKEIKIFGKAEKKDTLNRINLIRGRIEGLQRPFVESGEKGRIHEEDIRTIREGPLRDILSDLHIILKRAGPSIASRSEDLINSFDKIFSLKDTHWLNWYEKKKRGILFHSSPLDTSRGMQELLYTHVKTIVFTSATLSTNGSFHFIVSRLGIPENRLEGIYSSHFNFREQTLMYIPLDMPAPGTPEASQRIASRILEISNLTSGRALILFTSYSMLNSVYKKIAGNTPYTMFKQGDAPRSTLLEKFKQDTHSLLFATGSFWQGVDVPGESLSCLIVDKLPFDSPGDPLVAARIEAIHARGGNPFMEYQLPSAIISLKQGLGRLIRKRSDRGVISILDPRVVQSRYGRFFIDSLPEMPITHDLADIARFFVHPQ